MPYANPEDQREYYREWTKGVRRGPPDSVQLGTLLALIVSSPPASAGSGLEALTVALLISMDAWATRANAMPRIGSRTSSLKGRSLTA